jgi:hypothetical protein
MSIDTCGFLIQSACIDWIRYPQEPPVFRRFADSLAPHQNLVRAKTAAEPAGIKVIHVYGIAL